LPSFVPETRRRAGDGLRLNDGGGGGRGEESSFSGQAVSRSYL